MISVGLVMIRCVRYIQHIKTTPASRRKEVSPDGLHTSHRTIRLSRLAAIIYLRHPLLGLGTAFSMNVFTYRSPVEAKMSLSLVLNDRKQIQAYLVSSRTQKLTSVKVVQQTRLNYLEQGESQ